MRVWWGGSREDNMGGGRAGCKGFTRRLVVVLEFGEGGRGVMGSRYHLAGR